MTLTNTAATSARDPETDTKASVLDLGLDSIVLLKRQGKFSVKNIALAASFRGWLESSPTEGERWLRSSAQNGDLYAMEKLGLRLLTGDGLPKSPKEGLKWLKKSAELGNSFAMEKLAMIKLGTYLLSGWGLNHNQEEGLRWLRRAGATTASQLLELGLQLYQKSLAATRKAARGLEYVSFCLTAHLAIIPPLFCRE